MNLLPDSLRLAAEKNRGITFAHSNGADEYLPYGDLYRQALLALGKLQRLGLRQHHELVIQAEDNKQFLVTFWACVIGGIVPVPLSASGRDEQKLKLFTIWKYLNNPFLAGDAGYLEGLRMLPAGSVDAGIYDDVCNKAITVAELVAYDEPGQPATLREEDIAYIQFSSGSTGEPKGVCLTHKNLASNIKDIIKSLAITNNDMLLSWMPLTHDMGMIGFHLTGVRQAINTVSIATSAFIRKPAVWMDKAASHGATVLYSPNFGLHYFLSSLQKGQSMQWDLSRIRIIVNGAEAIAESICNDFISRMKPYGLRDNVMLSAYGLAEASVEVSAMPPGTPLISYWLDREHLNIGERPVFTAAAANGSVNFVDVGRVIDDCDLRICGEADEVLEDGLIGNIQIRGLNVTSGYYNNAEATRKAFTADGWLRTGDIGFMNDGRLVVTGRKKNIIIINGQNYYPQDIERIVTNAGVIETGKVVACGNRDEATQKEELVVFLLFKGAYTAFLPVADKVKEVLLQGAGIYADKVIPVQRIPKTTSGKVQHFLLLEQYRGGAFDEYIRFAEGEQGSGAERLLQQLRRLLGNESIQGDTDLVALGLNSLAATRVAALVGQITGTHILVHEIFSARTLNDILEVNTGPGKYPQLVRTAPVEFTEMSAAQQRIWMECQVNDQAAAYNIPVVYKISGNPDIALLERCMKQLIEKYEILRTSFEWKNGKPCQHIHAYADNFSCQYDDLRRVTAPDEELQSIVDSDVNGIFSLEQPTQLRLRITRLAEEEYVLVLVVHHIIIDGWSLNMLFNEWCALYNEQRVAGNPWQYRDYVAWQQQYLAGETAKNERAYWLNELEALPGPIGLNGSNRNVATDAPRLGHFEDTLDIQLLKKLAGTYETTPFSMLMALLNVLIYRYTNQKDLITGFDVAGRVTAGIDNIIGYTLNTLCLRVKLNGGQTFDEIARAVKASVFNALENQSYPFEQLMADKQANRLFSILVLYQNFYELQNTASFNGCQLREQAVEVRDGFMDLVLTCRETSSGLQLLAQYDASQYTADEMARFTRHLQLLLNAVANDPAQSICSYDILTPAEKKILFPVDNSAIIKHLRMPVHQLFERRAAAFPDAIAVECGSEIITYRQLNRLANAAARRLQNRYNIQPDDHIGFYIERNVSMIVAMLAILKAGAAYVAIDPDFPINRVKQMAQDSGMKCMLTEAATAIFLRNAFDDKFLVSVHQNDISSRDDENLPFTGGMDNLAYVIYTSGSTGNPKGVMITHGTLLHYVRQFTQFFGVNREDVFVQQASVGFDTIVEEVFTALSRSARVVIAKKGGRDIEQLIAVISEHKPTVLSTTPLVLNELNKHVDSRLASLRLVISGGDVLHPSHIDKLISNVQIYNTYGPSETTVCATYKEIVELNEASLIGRPIPGYAVYILDENGQHLPVGKAGELYIGGGLARGYLNQPALTAEKFIANPHNPAERLYKTGDIGRYLASGDIEFIGRSDAQIKIRGHRVEPGEIEQLIAEFAGIDNAAVVQSGDYLVAFITASRPVVENELRTFLSDHLPSYMVPHRFEAIEKMPYTTSGKIDRNALRKMADRRPAKNKTREMVPPATEMEKKLAAIWQEVLGVENVSITDNFFSLGGHSIKASQLLNRIYESTAIGIKLPDVFRFPTIAELAEKLTRQEQEMYRFIDIV